MDPMSGFDIRLVFTLAPRDSTLQYKRCVHLLNNFPCIKSLIRQSSYMVIKPTLSSELGGSIEITLTVPLREETS